MKIIHCSDLHLDADLRSRFDREEASQRRAELMHTFRRLCSYARQNSVRCILICGDLFDTQTPSPAAIRAVEDLICTHKEILFFLLRGNHDAETALKHVREAVASGLDVSCDLMCATPLQTGASWKESLRDVLACGVGHVSVYPLQIEEGTPLSREVGDSEPAWNSTDVQADRMEVAYRVLTVAGYEHYEVASYAKPGKRCHHNIAYWSGQTYLGLGTSAASMLTRGAYDTLRKVSSWLPQVPDQAFRMRLKVIDNLKPQVELEVLTGPQAVAEDLMLAMRTADGVSSDQLAYAERLLGKDKIERCIAKLVRRDLVLASDSTNKGHDGLEAATSGSIAARGALCEPKPTHQGWLLGNELYEALWDLAPGQETIVMEASA